MKRTLIVLVLAVTGLLAGATPASADVTFFLGLSTAPESRPAQTRGLGCPLVGDQRGDVLRRPDARDGHAEELLPAEGIRLWQLGEPVGRVVVDS